MKLPQSKRMSTHRVAFSKTSLSIPEGHLGVAFVAKPRIFGFAYAEPMLEPNP